MSQRDVFNGAPSYVLPSAVGALGDVLTVGPPATPNTLVWAAGESTDVTSGTITFTGASINILTAPYKQYITGGADKMCTICIGDSNVAATTGPTTGILTASALTLPSTAAFNSHAVITVYNYSTSLFYTGEAAIAGGSSTLLILFNTLGLVMSPNDDLSILGFSFSFPL